MLGPHATGPSLSAKPDRPPRDRSRHGKCTVEWNLDFTTTAAPSPATHAASASRPHPTLSRPILRMYSPRPGVPDRTYTSHHHQRLDRQLDCRINGPDARLKALANCCFVARAVAVIWLPLRPLLNPKRKSKIESGSPSACPVFLIAEVSAEPCMNATTRLVISERSLPGERPEREIAGPTVAHLPPRLTLLAAGLTSADCLLCA